jgi:hypothetical protein
LAYIFIILSAICSSVDRDEVAGEGDNLTGISDASDLCESEIWGMNDRVDEDAIGAQDAIVRQGGNNRMD